MSYHKDIKQSILDLLKEGESSVMDIWQHNQSSKEAVYMAMNELHSNGSVRLVDTGHKKSGRIWGLPIKMKRPVVIQND